MQAVSEFWTSIMNKFVICRKNSEIHNPIWTLVLLFFNFFFNFIKIAEVISNETHPMAVVQFLNTYKNVIIYSELMKNITTNETRFILI